jgi:hypothetical protein
MKRQRKEKLIEREKEKRTRKREKAKTLKKVKFDLRRMSPSDARQSPETTAPRPGADKRKPKPAAPACRMSLAKTGRKRE